jgi:hypothetical protein
MVVCWGCVVLAVDACWVTSLFTSWLVGWFLLVWLAGGEGGLACGFVGRFRCFFVVASRSVVAAHIPAKTARGPDSGMVVSTFESIKVVSLDIFV